ncbi:alpha/beta fold hydrolase [Novosphingobium sp. G106]|uniref:alpha/beta fold hydrolase n=1 Tax=Novosphingobium sp. G106 TaxID=2849500 RepID=UPI0020C29A5C|nr:alpha/beta hydrolase [Novosphingobium sp. G106]
MNTLMRTGWGQNNPAFRQVFTTLFFPEASQVEMDWFNELQRMTTSPANAIRLSEAFSDIDVRDVMAQVSVPTLVLHARDDAVAPFSAGRTMASTIRNAQFVVLESRNHLLMPTEPAWARFVSSVEEFLA